MAKHNSRQRFINCPICGSRTTKVGIFDEQVALALGIQPGIKSVCIGKHIRRTQAHKIFLNECYGLPVESLVKFDQFALSDQEVFNIMQKLPEAYMNKVISNDQFFTNVRDFFNDHQYEETGEEETIREILEE